MIWTLLLLLIQVPPAASVHAGVTLSPTRPVLPKSRICRVPTQLLVKACYGDEFSTVLAETFTISIRWYHIPTASVCLLSPQALYKSVGGHGEQDITKYSLVLPDGVRLEAHYGRANLPVLPMCSPGAPTSCFWSRCFSFHTSDRDVWAHNLLESWLVERTSMMEELM